MQSHPVATQLRRHLSTIANSLTVPYGFTLSVAGGVLSAAARFGRPTQYQVWSFALGAVLMHIVLSGFGRHQSSSPEVRQAGPIGAASPNPVPLVTIPLCALTANMSANANIAYPLVGAVCVLSYVGLLALVATIRRAVDVPHRRRPET